MVLNLIGPVSCVPSVGDDRFFFGYLSKTTKGSLELNELMWTCIPGLVDGGSRCWQGHGTRFGKHYLGTKYLAGLCWWTW